VNYRVLVLYLITAFTFGVAGARGLTIPLYADQLGASRGEIGLLFSTFTITGALLSLPSGVLADRFGRRNMVLFSLLAITVSQILSGITHDVRLLFVSQLIGGLGGGAAQTALFAALADQVPMERMGRAMGWLTLSLQVGFLAGPAVAGILLRWVSLQADILLTTIPILVAVLLSLAVSGRQAAKGTQLNLLRPVKGLAAQPGFYALVIVFLSATMLWGTFQAYIPVLGRRSFGISGTEVGYLLAIQAVANGASRIPAGRILDRVRRKGPIVSATVTGFALALLVLPHLHGFWIPTLVMVAAVPLIATAFIAISLTFVRMAPSDSRGAAMGVYSTILFLGLGAGPAIFAPLMDRSFVVGFTACALSGIALASVALLARIEPIQSRLARPAVSPPTP
jgi:MFS family permease